MPDPIFVEAFGEKKSINAWSKDDRCTVNHPAISYRLKKGWTPEDAITQPSCKMAKAFGEVKSLHDWSNDRRCGVSLTSLALRLKAGWNAEQAITAPPCKENSRTRFLTAFGESKSMADWARDDRCQVKGVTLRSRVYSGWPHELAITAPKNTRYRKMGH